MIQFIRNKEPGYCSLITFWQLIKAIGMDYNEFKSILGFTTPDEKYIRELWDRIHNGQTSYEALEKDFFTKNLDGGTRSMFDYVDEFDKVLYRAQTGIDIDEALSRVKHINDLVDWDEEKIIDTYEKFYQRVPAVPFITETFCFDDSFKFHLPEHVFITTLEKKVPFGPWTITHYDSDSDEGPIEYTSRCVHEPIDYQWPGLDEDTWFSKSSNVLVNI